MNPEKQRRLPLIIGLLLGAGTGLVLLTACEPQVEKKTYTSPEFRGEWQVNYRGNSAEHMTGVETLFLMPNGKYLQKFTDERGRTFPVITGRWSFAEVFQEEGTYRITFYDRRPYELGASRALKGTEFEPTTFRVTDASELEFQPSSLKLTAVKVKEFE